jgi:hypothetical protein
MIIKHIQCFLCDIKILKLKVQCEIEARAFRTSCYKMEEILTILETVVSCLLTLQLLPTQSRLESEKATTRSALCYLKNSNA